MAKQVLVLALLLVACSGEAGPTGPTGPAGDEGPSGSQGPPGQDGSPSVLAYGDVNVRAGGLVFLLSSGPPGVTVTTDWSLDMDALLTIDGSFPATEGTLVVSVHNRISPIPQPGTFISSNITQWSTTQITAHVRMFTPGAPFPDVGSFSFVVLGS